MEAAVYVVFSVRPKRVNTEITETKISVMFTEPKPIIPNRNSPYIRFLNILVLAYKKNLKFSDFLKNSKNWTKEGPNGLGNASE